MVCSWLEAAVDKKLMVPAADDGISLETLLTSAGGCGVSSDVISEGLSVGQGQWPLDR
jgi:hypothetical protein